MNISELEKIIAIFEQSRLTELSIDENETSIFLKKEGDVRVSHGSAPASAPAHPVHHLSHGVTSNKPVEQMEMHTRAHGKVDDKLKTIESPMVGTFYRSSSPTDASYVNVGDVIQKGQVLCIIEAMKLMNEIESDISGKIVQILVENSKPVEFGQPLFLIEPV